ncbi:MAG: WecB/TagA/CpsF family glycosyltransferase [Bacteroidota bacterium]
MFKDFILFDQQLNTLNSGKLLISTLNAHCYNMTISDSYYRESLLKSDVLLPDGISVVWAAKWLTGQRLTKISGSDLFYYEMERQQKRGGTVFFLGSTEETLSKITSRAKKEFPNLQVKTYSPPYKTKFSEEDNFEIYKVINTVKPDVLFIGMTAPKQEKWAYQNYKSLCAGHICCIGAVFDFYAGTIRRAPKWMIKIGMEWLYRLIKEPRRMWRRYLIGNILFISSIIHEKYNR